MKILSLLILIILLAGCTRYVEVEKNITIEKEVIREVEVIKEVKVIEYINKTCPEVEECPEGDYTRDYVLRLIREAKQCEKETHTNTTDLIEELSKMNKRYGSLLENFTDIRDIYCDHNNINCTDYDRTWC